MLVATCDGELPADGKYWLPLPRVISVLQRALEAATQRVERGRCVDRRDSNRIALVRRLARAGSGRPLRGTITRASNSIR